jgi:hypothetical protein
MLNKSINSDKYKFFLPLVALITFYILNGTSRNSFLNRPASFVSTNNSKLVLLVLAFTLMIVCINFLIYKIQKCGEGKLLPPLFLISYSSFILIPIIIDEFLSLNTFELINKIFRVSFIKPIFADLYTILTGIGCQAVNHVGDKIICDTKNDVLWNYPTVLLKLRVLNIDSKITFILGVLIAVIFLFVLFLFRDFTKIQKIFLTLLAFSPPLLLVVNRGNFDLLILICLVITGYSLNRNLKYSLEVSYLLILFAGTLKFYAIFALPLLLLFNRKIKNYLYFSLVSIIFILINFRDLWHLNRFVGRDMSGSFGLPVLISHLNGDADSDLRLLSIGALLVAIIFSYYFNYFKKKFNTINLDNYNDYIFLVLSCVFLMTWLLASNYYYRFVLLIFVIPFYFHKKSTIVENYIGLTCFFSFYLSYRTIGFIMNIFLIPMLAFNIFITYRVIKKKNFTYVK